MFEGDPWVTRPVRPQTPFVRVRAGSRTGPFRLRSYRYWQEDRASLPTLHRAGEVRTTGIEIRPSFPQGESPTNHLVASTVTPLRKKDYKRDPGPSVRVPVGSRHASRGVSGPGVSCRESGEVVALVVVLCVFRSLCMI